MEKLKIIVTGVGGQGVILASDIIAEVALAAGYDVKKTDTLGMAQRGGSVISHIRIGSKVWSPLNKEGEVDIILAFEKLEGARWGYFLRSGGIAIINNQANPPLAVNLGNEKYPGDEEIIRILNRWTRRIFLVEGSSRARELGNSRCLNTFMLGCASVFIPMSVQIWKEKILQRIPARASEVNIKAFEQGREEIGNANI